MIRDSLQLSSKIYGKITQYNLDRENAASERTLPGATLFHYTSTEGLIGIIERSQLWATSAYYLNDSSEVLYGYGVLSEVLRDWISSRELPKDSLSLAMARQLQDGFGNHLLNRNIITPVYLACFCEDGNLLSQWRAYSESGGYCLGFTAFGEGPVRAIKPEPCVYTARWVKVEYERPEQMRRCREVLDRLLPILEEPGLGEALRNFDPSSQFGFDGFLRAISDVLVEEIIAFKSKAFEVEKEWRIVVRAREMLKQGTDDGGRSPIPVNFRTSKGLLIPYVKLIPSEGKDLLSLKFEGLLPITSVRIGPTRDETTAAMATRMLLDKHGYEITRIDKAGISLVL